MSKGVYFKRVVQAGLILLFAPLVGCTFLAVESADWVTSMGSVCIQVEQSYTGLSNHTEPIAEELQGVLSRIGVEATIGEGTDCEAVLAVTLQFTPIAEQVIGPGGPCYLSAEATGKATLSATGHNTLTLPLKHSKSTGGGIRIVHYCPKQPDQAPFDGAWAGEVANMLREWWGSPALVSALKADTRALRLAATYQLTSMGPEAYGAIPVLVEMLGDADPQMREDAAKALGTFGPAAAEAVPALIQALHDSAGYTRLLAAEALEKMGPAAAPAIPDLIDAIDDEFEEVGRTAVDALGAIGPEADEAIPVLIKLLEGEDWTTYHFNAARALRSITGQDFGKDAAAWRQWWESQP